MSRANNQKLTLPAVTASNLALEENIALAREWFEAANVELARRAALTPEQWLAERMNYAFSREPGEAWYYEGDDWSKPEHKRWLDKARILLRHVPDPEEALTLARSIR